jgi:hypothetical protein
MTNCSAERLDVDLVVIGAGFAGLTAAARAASRGHSVLLLEAAAEPGGSAMLSNGYLWSAPDIDAALQEDPGIDVDLARAVIEGLEPLTEWIASLNVHMEDEVLVHGFGRGRRIDIVTYVAKCVGIVERAGGHLLRSVQVTSAVPSPDGWIVSFTEADGTSAELLSARGVVLATGGFQANDQLRSQHLGGDGMVLRSNTWSDGAGLRLAVAAGAATEMADGDGAFYGHLIGHPLARFEPSDFLRLSLLFSNHGILLNTRGERFTDEARWDHKNALAVSRQAERRAVLVLTADQAAELTDKALVAGMETIDPITEGAELGARTSRQDTSDELAASIADWGLRRRDDCKGAARRRPLGRAIGRDRGPTRCDVLLRRDRGRRHRLGTVGIRAPIPGLKAAGADVGNLYGEGYIGGLSFAGVLGMIAVDDLVGTRC